MNIEKVLFDRITSNLEEVLDTVPPLSTDMQQEVGLFTRELYQKILMDFHNCPDESKKTPQRLLGAIFDGAVLMRDIFDACENFEGRQETIFSFIADYDMWDGRLEKLIGDDKEYMDYSVTKDLAISETIALCRDEFGIDINEGVLILLMQVLSAFALFCFRIKFDLLRDEKVHSLNFSLLGFIKDRLF